MERVLFNLSGRSPLVAHYLYVKNLRRKETLGKLMKRTEVVREPYPFVFFCNIKIFSLVNVDIRVVKHLDGKVFVMYRLQLEKESKNAIDQVIIFYTLVYFVFRYSEHKDYYRYFSYCHIFKC